jgi:small subunit ribosomal protein S1
VLDIDRDRQRISLGLKQTQSDPWQQVLENYHEGDVVEGRVTKVVTFGAFVEILPGVEGLVHISELAQHHVENPREIVTQGQPVNVKIIEVDAERRRLSLSLKRVEDTDPVQPRADGAESVHTRPQLDLSEDVFAEAPVTAPTEDVEAPFEVPTADDATGEADATGAGGAPAAEMTAADETAADEGAAEPGAVPAAAPPNEE